MSNTVIVTLMTNLINKRYYGTAEEAIGKLDVYFAMDRITKADYSDLVMLAKDVYALSEEPVEPENPVEPEIPEEPESPVEPPEIPAEPEVPAEPDNQEEAEIPVEPDPETPVEPETPVA